MTTTMRVSPGWSSSSHSTTNCDDPFLCFPFWIKPRTQLPKARNTLIFALRNFFFFFFFRTGPGFYHQCLMWRDEMWQETLPLAFSLSLLLSLVWPLRCPKSKRENLCRRVGSRIERRREFFEKAAREAVRKAFTLLQHREFWILRNNNMRTSVISSRCKGLFCREICRM